MQVLILDLGDRHVEFVPQPVLQAFHDVPFLFERMGILDPQLQGQHADCSHDLRDANQPASFATLCMTKASITSPCLTSLKLSSVMPHSMPDRTSLTSSLKRRNEATLPVWTTTLSRRTRTCESRVM